MTLRYSKPLLPCKNLLQMSLSINKLFDNDKHGLLELLPHNSYREL